MTQIPPPERLRDLFWAKVSRTETCWRWSGAIHPKGYGTYSWQEMGKQFAAPAHRVAYAWEVGPIPEGLQLDHLCRVRACVRPEHLEPVSCKENLLRGNTVNAAHAAQSECLRGHSLTGGNLYTYRGKRICKACARLRTAKRNTRRES